MDLDLKSLTQLVDHRGGGQRANDIALLASLFDQVHHQQRHHLQLVDEGPPFVDDAHPVRVAVVGDPEIEAALSHPRHRLRHVLADRFRVHAAEAGVPFAVDFLDRGLAAREQRPDVALAGAVHRLVKDLEPGALDRRQVDQAVELGGVGRLRVEGLDLPLPRGLVEAHLADPATTLHLLDFFLQPRGDLGRGRARVLGLVFQAAEVVRIVARRDDQAAARFLVEDGEGRHLCRRRGVDDEDLDAVRGQHLGHFAGEEIRGKPGVVADDRGWVRPADQVLGDALGGYPNRFIGEVVGDDAAPAIRAERDFHG